MYSSFFPLRLYDGVPRIFFPLIWFEQKVRITPELASDLKVIPCVLLGGQIFAGVLFAIGLIMLGWYPVQQLCLLGRRRRTIKIHATENGNCKGTEGKTYELKPLQSKTNPAHTQYKDKTTTPDQSPLLEKSAKIATVNPQPNENQKF